MTIKNKSQFIFLVFLFSVATKHCQTIKGQFTV